MSLTAFLDEPRVFADDPFPHYARLRREAPVARHEDPGYWVVSKHRDVVAISRDPRRFCSSRGVLVTEIGTTYPTPPTMMHTDPPEHTHHRARVQPEFSAAAVRHLEARVRSRARMLVERIPTGEAVDVVDVLAAEFPLRVIADLLGIPETDWPRFRRWSDAAIPDAEGFAADERLAELAAMQEYLLSVAHARRDRPAGDLVSRLAAGATDDELTMFLVQLLVAGNETTRNLIAGGLYALAEHPDQWQAIRDDPGLVTLAAEEWLRWTTPVVSFLRTATRDTALAGRALAAGDHVLLLYASANRDEDVFGEAADRFDVRRQPNPHLAFGTGPHFCLGAALARLEARVVLEELTRRFRSVTPAGPLRRSPSSIIAGYRRVPVAFAR